MQRRIAIPVLAALLSVSALQLHAADNDKKTEKASEAPAAPADSTTEGTVTVGGQAIAYTAVAGTLTVGATPSQDSQLDLEGHWLPDSGVKTDKPDEAPPTARIFYVAYFKKGASNQTRPITFCYNGGPGSSTMWLHMGSFGPKRVVTQDTIHEAGAPYKIENNDYSLLDVSDLVFIDAPATGFSRVFGKDAGKSFFGIDEDARAFERFIRRFMTKYDRWNSPKYIFGESYGTPRSAVLSNDLQGIDLNGVILLSAILSFDNSVDGPKENPGVDQAYALALPTYAATAWYHKKLSSQPAALEPFLKEVEDFALGEYMSALLQGSELPEARKQAVAEKLHNYTGLPVAYLMKSDLRVEGGAFSKTLKDEDGISVGRLDTRYEGPDMDPLSESTEYDPQSAAVSAAYTTGINQYLRDELKYGQNWTYRPNAYGSEGFRWQMRYSEGGQNVMPDLARKMKEDPKMKVLLTGGYYDLATPFFEGMYEMHHLQIPQKLQANISYKYYQAGHMIYVNGDVLNHFHEDVAAFIKATESAK